MENINNNFKHHKIKVYYSYKYIREESIFCKIPF